MATSIITPEQAAAILRNGKPFGVGGKTIRLIGLSHKSDAPLFTRTRFIKDPNAGPHSDMDGTTVVDESTRTDLPPINDLMGGLTWQQLRNARDKAVSSLTDYGRCYMKDESALRPPFSDVTVIRIDFNKNKLEEVQQRGAGASKQS